MSHKSISKEIIYSQLVDGSKNLSQRKPRDIKTLLPSAFQAGMDWREKEKRTLEDLESLDKNSELALKLNDKAYKISFTKGYNVAIRKELIAKMERKAGAKFYFDGGDFEMLTDEQRKKLLTDNFMSGYEEARLSDNKGKKR